MYTRPFALLVLALALFVGPSWAQSSCLGTGDGNPQTCSIVFSPGVTTGTFDFSGTGDGVIVFQFETVLTTFTLTVAANDVASIPSTSLDLTEFPAGTVCIMYTKNSCVRYDVSGNASGPNNTPVRGVDYKGIITLTLNYNSFQNPRVPAFGHAPGDFSGAIFSEDILTNYVDEHAPSCSTCEGPAMGGKTPGISSFAALDKPFANSATGNIVCPFLTAVPQTSSSGQNPIVEVSFKLVASNCNTDPPLRDKTATLSVASHDTPTTLVFTSLVNNGDANKFHFDNKAGLNVQDINTNGLAPGLYYVTVTSSKFSPVTTTFTVPTP